MWMRFLVVLLFWLFVASVTVKAQRSLDRRRGRRTSQRIADGLHMLSQVIMEHASNHIASTE